MNENPERERWWARLLEGVVTAIDFGDSVEGACSLLGHAFEGIVSVLLGFWDGL